MQCKDIPVEPILDRIREVENLGFLGASAHTGYESSIDPGFPLNTPKRLQLAKLQKLINQGIIEGCTCGCRGDFRIPTTK